MRALFPLLLLFATLFAACNETPKVQQIQSLDTLSIGGRLYSIEPITESAFNAVHTDNEDTSELRNIQRDANLVHRNGDTLFLKKTDGTYLHLINNYSESDDSFANYSYQYYLDDLGYYVVYAGFWEWYNYLIIHPSTEKIIYACGPPVVSPDLKSIMTYNEDLFAGFTFNGFECYTVEKDSLRLTASKEIEGWGPAKIKWIKNDELLVHQSVIDTLASNNTRNAYIKLKGIH